MGVEENVRLLRENQTLRHQAFSVPEVVDRELIVGDSPTSKRNKLRSRLSIPVQTISFTAPVLPEYMAVARSVSNPSVVSLESPSSLGSDTTSQAPRGLRVLREK